MRGQQLTDLDRFFSRFQSFHFKKGEMVLRAGDPIPGIYYLKRGFVRLYTLSQKGEELTLIIFQKGDIFPITWTVNSTVLNRKNYYLESMGNSELFRANKDKFLQFIREDNEALFELTSRLSDRLAGLLIRAESFVFGDAYRRVASIILICAERFGKTIESGVEIQAPLTHRDIASLIGVARETASIEIKKLERQGFIGYRGRFLVVKNGKGLKRESVRE